MLHCSIISVQPDCGPETRSMTQGLGDTIARLRRARQAGGSPAPRHSARRPRFVETAGFGANPGALRMTSFRPASFDKGAPLVVVLHGCTQYAEAYAADAGWIAMAERCGFALLAPEQTAANNFNRCFNWFQPEDTARGAGEAASIAEMVGFMLQDGEIDPERVFITGLSAGGAMTAVMLATYPELFAGGAIIAGLPYGLAGHVGDGMRLMRQADGRGARELGALVSRAAPKATRRPRLSIWHGDADHVVSPVNADQLASQWAAAYGLPHAPSDREKLDGQDRAIWRAPEDGEVMIETRRVHGMGHGTPLATRGEGAVGAAAPFMLDVGVSSTREIAAFWGLKEPPAAKQAEAKGAPPARPAPADAARRKRPAQPAGPAPHAGGLGAQVMGSVSKFVSADVQAVIAKALKSAGLLK
jgi:poly(hydroxyalkanoate) depolymerase family esterase